MSVKNKQVISEHMSMIQRRRWANMTDEQKEKHRENCRKAGKKGAAARWKKEDVDNEVDKE